MRSFAEHPQYQGLQRVDLWERAVAAAKSPAEASKNVSKVTDELAAFSLTTSGVEQAFTFAQWSNEARRSWMTSSLEENELKIVADCRDPADWPELLELFKRSGQ